MPGGALSIIAAGRLKRSPHRSYPKAESLMVKPDGRIFQGNTRIEVLEERGYPVNELPRVSIP